MTQTFLVIISLFLIISILFFYKSFQKNLKNKENYLEINSGCSNCNSVNSGKLRDQNFSKYKFRCLRPPNYHRYGSNLSDPTQDRLPITFPDPNEGIPPIELKTKEEEIIYNLKNGII